ncbi:MAG: flavin reductase [Bacillota bacterium]
MKKWRCTVCGYIHEGTEPPEECPVCHAPREAFVLVEESGVAPATGGSASPVVPLEPPTEDVKAGLFAISYGLFVVSSVKDSRFNGQTCNTVFQVTSDPPRVAVGINKSNLTHEYIKASNIMAVTVLGKGNMRLVKHFGFNSGRKLNKFEHVAFTLSPRLGCPVVSEGTAYLECTVRPELSSDLGTHTLFVADVVGGGKLRGTEPITYAYYRTNRSKPEEWLDDVDWGNVVTSLNLEFGANRRYRYQIEQLNHPRLTSILEGVMRTEADHVQNAIQYLNSQLPRKLGNAAPRGLSRALLFMMLNQEFEEVARATYSQFSQETQDPSLKQMFIEQARSEQGHINIFRELVEALKSGQFPTAFFCPVCGWELPVDSPAEGTPVTCPKCGAKFVLALVDGSWELKSMAD